LSIPHITRVNIVAAISQVEREGVPQRRRATKYVLIHGRQSYPPKYVVSLAVKSATGRELDPQEFGGGDETNSLLRKLGFTVVPLSKSTAGSCLQSANAASSLGVAHERGIIGRVVTAREGFAPDEGEHVMLGVLRKEWPHGLRLKFLITPGGFIQAPFPKGWAGGRGWGSDAKDLKVLTAYAEKVLLRSTGREVLTAAKDKVDFITTGIDLVGRSDTDLHAELVAVQNVGTGRICWTGKSYPTQDQEANLVQVADLRTHFMRIGGERILVPGCHDLNMFSPRGWCNQAPHGVRHQRCGLMRRMVKEFKPTIVLQHPHSTDSPNIWRSPWSELLRKAPTVNAWASGIAYYNRDGKCRAPRERVLRDTCGGSKCYDFCVHGGG
jgi:hypothetical protein